MDVIVQQLILKKPEKKNIEKIACVGVEMSLEVVDNELRCFEMCSEDVLSMV